MKIKILISKFQNRPFIKIYLDNLDMFLNSLLISIILVNLLIKLELVFAIDSKSKIKLIYIPSLRLF